MKITISKECTFDASHQLDASGLAPDHKCQRLHGHTYRVVVELTGEIDHTTGLLVDYGVIADVIGQLDHRHLNDIPGLRRSTTENVVLWIVERIRRIGESGSVQVFESSTTHARAQW